MSTETRNHNIHIFNEIHFKQHSNTTVFFRDSLSIISPSVSENRNGGYWFDIRDVNIKRLTKKSILVVRIVPNLFILKHLEDIKSLITPQSMDNRPHSGDVWGLGLNVSRNEMIANMFNKKDVNASIQCQLLNKEETINKIKSWVG